MSGARLLEVRGLRTWFRSGGRWLGRPEWIRAVDGVDLDLSEGEVLGLVGESGCGKSTLARSILRLVKPTAGVVRFEGRDVLGMSKAELRGLRRRMQVVFQNPYASLSPRMRIGRIVAEPLRLHGVVERRGEVGAVEELLGQVGLEPYFMHRYPHELSGGQRQRVAIARAIAVRPSLLVADEPVSALDVSVRARTLGILRELQARTGIAMLFISHDLAVVEQMCDRVAVMYAGRIVEEGETRTVVDRPLHPYTRALVCAVPRPEVGPSSHRRVSASTTGEPGVRAGATVDAGAAVAGAAVAGAADAGCAYAARCPEVRGECRRVPPPLEVRVDGHRVACHVRSMDADAVGRGAEQ